MSDITSTSEIVEKYLKVRDASAIRMKLYSGDPVNVLPYNGSDMYCNHQLVTTNVYINFTDNSNLK